MLPIQFKVGAGGNNPIAGATEWNYPALKGINGFIDKSGFGIWGYSNYQVLSSGGIRLLNGLEFSGDDDFSFVPVGLFYQVTGESGSYTNGFNLNAVLSKLVGRLGWMQTPGSPTLDGVNLTSKSGRFFNDSSFHQLVSLKNLYDTIEVKSASDLVFNEYLVATQRAIILKCLNGVFKEPEFVSQSLAYNRRGYGNNDKPYMQNAGKFVGYQIKVANAVDLATQIDSIGLNFSGDATFNIYVFNDVKKEPVFVKQVTAEANNQVVVELDDFVLNHLSNTNHGGIFYLGYFQNDLPEGVYPIWETNVDFHCGFTYGLRTITSAAVGNTFNKSMFSYTGITNGLNPHISVFRDHTQQIIKKANLFDNLVGLQNAAQCLEGLLWTTRSNGTERGLKDSAEKAVVQAELSGVMPISDPGPKTIGLRKLIDQETVRVHDSFFPKQKMQVVSLC